MHLSLQQSSCQWPLSSLKLHCFPSRSSPLLFTAPLVFSSLLCLVFALLLSSARFFLFFSLFSWFLLSHIISLLSLYFSSHNVLSCFIFKLFPLYFTSLLLSSLFFSFCCFASRLVLSHRTFFFFFLSHAPLTLIFLLHFSSHLVLSFFYLLSYPLLSSRVFLSLLFFVSSHLCFALLFF